MDRMNHGSNGEERLDALFAEYREAFPDPEPSADFTPKLWQKIEARRVETTWVFRRLAQICVAATVALTLLIGTVLMPSSDNSEVFYSGSYVDILAADHAEDFSQILPVGDEQ
jgi:negative regulator of sigma E activity